MIIKKTLFAFSLFILTLFVAGSVSAQTFRYPVAELGYCRDAKECYLYCQIEENKPTCWSYGKYILLPQVLGVSTTGDPEIEKEARDRGITFPIAELGNCKNVGECKAYCDSPNNQNSCMEFARAKKFGAYKEEGQMMERARQELGCDSYQSCRSFCENPANHERCLSFGDKHAPEEYRQKKEEFLQKAREGLGCTNFASCRNFCDNPNNRKTCERFAKQHMPEEYRQRREEMEKRMGERRDGPGGCNSEESCRKYCEDPAHKDECRRPGGENGEFRDGSEEQRYMRRNEQKGCSNEAECRSICEQNPERCPGFRQGEDTRKRQEEEYKKRYEEQQRNQQQYQQNQQYQPQNYQNYQGQPPQGGSYPSPEQYQQQQSQTQYQPPSGDSSGSTQPPPPQEGGSYSPPPSQ